MNPRAITNAEVQTEHDAVVDQHSLDDSRQVHGALLKGRRPSATHCGRVRDSADKSAKKGKR